MASSLTWESFEIVCPKVSFAAQYTSHQRSHTKATFEEACKLLTRFMHRDINILRFWSNISEDAYSDLTSTMTENEILLRLTREPKHTGPTRLAEMIARLVIYIPHPDEDIPKSRFDFDTEHASTYQDNDTSTIICIHPNVFDLNVIKTEETITNILPKNTSIFFCSILIAHELTHAVRPMDNAQIDTPKLPLFASNATGPTPSSTIFDAGNAIERHLLGGELGISWTPVPFLFLIVRSGKSKILYQPIIDACIETQSISPILNLLASNPSLMGLTSFDVICSSGRKRHTFSPRQVAVTHEYTDDGSVAEETNTSHSPNMPILTFTRTR